MYEVNITEKQNLLSVIFFFEPQVRLKRQYVKTGKNTLNVNLSEIIK